MPFGTSRIWSASPPLLAMKVPPVWPSGLNCGGGLRVCFFCMSNSGPFRSASFNKHFPFTWQANQSLHNNYRSTKQQEGREGGREQREKRDLRPGIVVESLPTNNFFKGTYNRAHNSQPTHLSMFLLNMAYFCHGKSLDKADHCDLLCAQTTPKIHTHTHKGVPCCSR
jgi:hypothetical protein